MARSLMQDGRVLPAAAQSPQQRPTPQSRAAEHESPTCKQDPAVNSGSLKDRTISRKKQTLRDKSSSCITLAEKRRKEQYAHAIKNYRQQGSDRTGQELDGRHGRQVTRNNRNRGEDHRSNESGTWQEQGTSSSSATCSERRKRRRERRAISGHQPLSPPWSGRVSELVIGGERRGNTSTWLPFFSLFLYFFIYFRERDSAGGVKPSTRFPFVLCFVFLVGSPGPFLFRINRQQQAMVAMIIYMI